MLTLVMSLGKKYLQHELPQEQQQHNTVLEVSNNQMAYFQFWCEQFGHLRVQNTNCLALITELTEQCDCSEPLHFTLKDFTSLVEMLYL